MSRMICRDCKHDIGEYENMDTEIDVCPFCGSRSLERVILLEDSFEFHEMSKGNSDKISGKRPDYEFVAGDEFSRSKRKYVDKVRIIDRQNDHYYEKVTDKETGEITHECSEPLSEHRHGSDKSQAQK